MYVYSGYWRTWSRILGRRPNRIRVVVELNLTPINAHNGQHLWDKNVAPIVLRAHSTPKQPDDKIVDELPVDVLIDMRAHLPESLVQRLLTEDFLSQVDWDKYDKVCNGGAKLADIVR